MRCTACSRTQTYPTLSGTNVARDFVEFPSQFNEHWALDPTVLEHYAVNYQTGTANPAGAGGQDQEVADLEPGLRRWASCWRRPARHAVACAIRRRRRCRTSTSSKPQALARRGTDFANVPTRYRSSYFLHIWANGYSAGYYAYQWTVMLDDDAYAWFEKNGGLTRQNGQRFRDMVLSRGNTLDYAQMYRTFSGHDPQIQPYLEYYGLTGGDTVPAPTSTPMPAPAATPAKKGERG